MLFRGIGQRLQRDNILAVRILSGNPTTYSALPNKPLNEAPESAGAETVLVSGLQGRNNARIVVSGSQELFSNNYFGLSSAGNRLFSQAISQWAFRESGVLRYRDIVHHKSDGTPPDVILHEKPNRPDLPSTLYPDPEIARNALVYRIKDEIVFSVTIEELKDDLWVPFCKENDMQLEFVMLDAYVRKNMTCNPQTGRYSVQFTVPDNYGVFKFRLLYRREGLTVIHTESQVSIRPFKHDEHERFILAATPYYTAAFSGTIAFLVFAIAFLFSSD